MTRCRSLTSIDSVVPHLTPLCPTVNEIEPFAAGPVALFAQVNAISPGWSGNRDTTPSGNPLGQENDVDDDDVDNEVGQDQGTNQEVP
jgi:hypothetical protein